MLEFGAWLIDMFSRTWPWCPGRCGDVPLSDAAAAGEEQTAHVQSFDVAFGVAPL
jgi:hypothetical protein